MIIELPLTSDPAHNMKLGSIYLGDQLARFGDNPALAATGSGLAILVDEAHTLPTRLIEELRLLTNIPTPMPAPASPPGRRPKAQPISCRRWPWRGMPTAPSPNGCAPAIGR